MQPSREKPYPPDVSDAEWAFVAPFLALLPEDAVQHRHDLREVFSAVRWILRAGAPWRMLPLELPPWPLVEMTPPTKQHRCSSVIVGQPRSNSLI